MFQANFRSLCYSIALKKTIMVACTYFSVKACALVSKRSRCNVTYHWTLPRSKTMNVSRIKRSALERERYVLCYSDVVLVSTLDHLPCVNLDSWVLAICSCYKNLFREKTLPFCRNCAAYWAVNTRRTRHLFFCFPFSLNFMSCSVARDESYVYWRKRVSTTSRRYLHNDISCLELIDIFKISRQKYMTNQIYLCSSKKVINDCPFSGACSKKKGKMDFYNSTSILKASVYVIYIQYF